MGKLFSIQSSLETLSKLVGSSVFTGIYAATVNVLPAAAYLSEAASYPVSYTHLTLPTSCCV